jgi:hypothetical protein
MNKTQTKYHKCKYSEKTWFLVIIGTAIVVSFITIIAVAYLGHKSFNSAVLTTVSKVISIDAPHNDNLIKITDKNTFVEHITGFYETVITIFSILIGLVLVLVIGFIYLRNVSKSEVREVIREETDSDFFKSYLKEHLENVFKASTKDGSLGAFIEDQDEKVEEKYEMIEKMIENMKSEIKELKDTVIALQGTIETFTNNNQLTQVEDKGGSNGDNKKV